jgi:apolipoprotein N-acyltransferase
VDLTIARLRSAGPPTWLWLLIGAVLLPFAAYQGVIPLAAWLAPVFLLRFVRVSGRGGLALVLVFLAYLIAALIGWRGTNAAGIDLAWGLVAAAIHGGLLMLAYAADRLIGPRLDTWPRLFVFPTAFVAVDWLPSLFNATGTFGSPAYSQYGDLALMQLASVTGIWGVTFLIGWFASTVNAAWERGFHWSEARGPVAAFGLVVAAVVAFGIVRLGTSTPATSTVPVAAVTADQALVDAATADIDLATFYASTDEQRAAARPRLAATVDSMLTRTEAALRSGARIVAWQEDAIWVLEEDRQAAIDLVAGLAKRYDAYVQMTAGVLTRAPGLPYLRNQAILLDPSGAVAWTYDKTHPVFPGEWLGTLPGSGALPVLDTPDGRLSTAICNDVGYPAFLHQAGSDGVAILLAPTHTAAAVWATNDAAEATYRAIENGVTLVRPTGNGPTLIDDPEGRVLASSDGAVGGAVVAARVPTQGVTTIYAWVGDAFAYLCVLALAGLAAFAYVRGSRTTTEGRTHARAARSHRPHLGSPG